MPTGVVRYNGVEGSVHFVVHGPTEPAVALVIWFTTMMTSVFIRVTSGM